jgi:DNA-binding transcriptional LysR family regulator
MLGVDMYSRGLEAFLAVVRTQNISKASEKMHLAQSTVSKRIQVLEQEIGVQLFERGKGLKTIRLTPAGELFVDLAERWISLSREMNIMQTEGPKLVLSIGMLDSLINSIFPILFECLINHQSQHRLKIISSVSKDAYDLIESRQVDVAFSLLERHHQSIHVQLCFTEPLVVLRTATFAQTPNKIWHPSDLDPQDELYITWGQTYQLWHDSQWELSANKVQINTANLALQLLRHDRQWTILPESVAKNAVLRGNFSYGYLSEPPPKRVVYKLTHKYPKASTLESLKIFDHYLNCLLADI